MYGHLLSISFELTSTPWSLVQSLSIRPHRDNNLSQDNSCVDSIKFRSLRTQKIAFYIEQKFD